MSSLNHTKLKTFAGLSIILGVISLVLLIFDYLALTDIWRGQESDLQQEWLVVALSFVPIILFHLCVFAALIFVLKSTRKTGLTDK